MTLDEFLKRWPWPAEWAGERPVEWFWNWELPASPEELWPGLSDTTSFNQRIGLSEVKYKEQDGVLHGSSVNAGVTLNWVEAPWEWEYARGLANTRVYSTGFARFVRARFVLEEAGPQRSRVTVYFGFIPRGTGGRLLLKLSEGWMRGRFDGLLRKMAQALRARVELPPLPGSPLAPGAAEKLAECEKRLLAEGCDAQVARGLLRWLAEAPDQDLLRLRPRALARALEAEQDKMLTAVLHATRAGALTLSWDVICPHCRGARAELATLGDVPARAACEPCGVEFEATGLSAMEATFRVHPSVRAVEPRVFCAAEPAKKRHIVLQRLLPPAADIEVETLLPAGPYRLRARGDRDAQTLELPARGRVRLRNAASQPRLFALERDRGEADALRPGDLFARQEFRDLFPAESVGEGIQLEVGVQTILFTDLVGSTRFYEQVGDAAAFSQVRGHFVRIFDAVRRRRGAVVKTIGDAALGAFPSAADALAAALELQEWFNARNRSTDLRIRISVHTGPCLAVKLNSGIDYFGSTVNLAAKLQAVVEAQQVVYTDATAQAGGRAVIEKLAYRPEDVDFPMKWSGGRMTVRRLTVP
jgi:class 3 adenylate cyclase